MKNITEEDFQKLVENNNILSDFIAGCIITLGIVAIPASAIVEETADLLKKYS